MLHTDCRISTIPWSVFELISCLTSANREREAARLAGQLSQLSAGVDSDWVGVLCLLSVCPKLGNTRDVGMLCCGNQTFNLSCERTTSGPNPRTLGAFFGLGCWLLAVGCRVEGFLFVVIRLSIHIENTRPRDPTPEF